MNVFVFLKPNGIEEKIQHLMQMDKPDALRAFSQSMELAFKDLSDWATGATGNRVCEWGTHICLEIPVDKVNDLPGYLGKYESTTGMDFAIGIGMSPYEAFKALLVAENNPDNKVVMYSDEIEEQLESDEWSELEKGLPDTAYEGGHSVDIPGLKLDTEPESPAEKPTESPSAPAATPKANPKQKVIQTLTQVKQMAPAIAQLKESNPEVYKAIKSIIDAMIAMASKDEFNEDK